MRTGKIFIILFFLSLSGSGGSLLFDLVSPACASEDLLETRLDEGLSNTEPYSFLLIQKAREDRQQAKELLQRAGRYSPDLPAVYFELSRVSFALSAEGLFESVDYLRRGFQAYERNFWWEYSLAWVLTVSLIFSYVLSLCVLLVIRFPAGYGLIHHDISEDRRRILLLAALVILSLFGFLPLITGALFFIGFYFTRRDKVVVYSALLLLMLSPLAARVVNTLMSPPSPELKAIVAVNEGRDNRYALTVLRNSADFAGAFSYALALKREGYYQEALAAYLRLLSEYQSPQVYVNLGNAYYAMKNLEAANESYKNSIELKPLPAAFYNLSQVHRELLDFGKGEEYFLEAAKLDREATSRFASLSSKNPNRFVIDETLPPQALWKYVPIEEGSSVFTSAVALVMILSFYMLDRKMKVRARRCKRCRAVFCRKCSRSPSWGEMCPQCYKLLIRAEELDSRERVARLLSLHQSQTAKRRAVKVLSSVLPGTGQIYAGRLLPGILFLWVFLFSLILLVANSVPFVGVAPFSHGWVTPLGVCILVLAYLFSILHMRRGIQRGWL